jgi:hypothetical protein
MAFPIRAGSALLFAGLMLAGCADGNGLFTTGSLGSQTAAAEPKVDPACVTLASRIETLRKEGVADKIEKAAAKKYKMTQSDLTKADQLTKASAEFQDRCSTITPRANTAQVSSAPVATASAAGTTKSAKAPGTPAAATAAKN